MTALDGDNLRSVGIVLGQCPAHPCMFDTGVSNADETSSAIGPEKGNDPVLDLADDERLFVELGHKQYSAPEKRVPSSGDAWPMPSRVRRETAGRPSPTEHNDTDSFRVKTA